MQTREKFHGVMQEYLLAILLHVSIHPLPLKNLETLSLVSATLEIEYAMQCHFTQKVFEIPFIHYLACEVFRMQIPIHPPS